MSDDDARDALATDRRSGNGVTVDAERIDVFPPPGTRPVVPELTTSGTFAVLCVMTVVFVGGVGYGAVQLWKASPEVLSDGWFYVCAVIGPLTAITVASWMPRRHRSPGTVALVGLIATVLFFGTVRFAGTPGLFALLGGTLVGVTLAGWWGWYGLVRLRPFLFRPEGKPDVD